MNQKFIHYVTKAPRPEITLHAVNSSQVKAVGYDAESKTLVAQFTRGAGAIYHYPGFSAEDHKAFIEAESIGKHFGKHIQHLPFDKYVPAPVEAEA